MWFADVLHPNNVDFDARAEIKAWYSKLYGKTPTDRQIDHILQMDMNADSANDKVARDDKSFAARECTFLQFITMLLRGEAEGLFTTD